MTDLYIAMLEKKLEDGKRALAEIHEEIRKLHVDYNALKEKELAFLRRQDERRKEESLIQDFQRCRVTLQPLQPFIAPK